MLRINNLVGFGAERDSHRLYDIINRAGLLSSCKVCIDAADALSYTSGQTITDRIAGNNYFLGTTVGVDVTDPTFVGPADDPGAYFSFDGGDYFLRTAAQTWDDNLHKAGGKFSLLLLYYPLATKTATSGLWSNRDNTGSSAGVSLRCQSSPSRVQLRRSTSTTISSGDTVGITLAGAAWNFVCVGWDDASALVRGQINNTHESQTGNQSTDTDPVSGNETLLGYSGGTNLIEAGERWAGFAAFDTLLSEAQMSGLRSAIAGTRPGYA